MNIVKGKRIPSRDRQAFTTHVITQYAAGGSIRSIAAATGRSYGNIHSILTAENTSLRPRGGRRRPVGPVTDRLRRAADES